ncbi:hypothetical protein AB0D42_33520, partial [Streptomyces sp. NPDC048304]|uniref:hypothetical protein n=1 Tax=Streptomyces sp. NPDC048304 TaxID=3154820 RepID=UPI0033F3D2E3
MSDTVMWLIGFRYNSGPDRTIRCFYLVDNATDRQHARQIAADRAETPAERRRRNHRVLDRAWTELRCLHCDFIGRWNLEPAKAATPRLDVVSFGESAVADEAAGDGGEGQEVFGLAFVA